MEGPDVRVSVCIPTYHRPASLGRLLDRLCQLEPPAGGYEIVIVDDGSPTADGISDLLAAAAVRSPVPLRWQTVTANAGAAAARNQAWRSACGEWIAFTDDDCVPARDWLIRLCQHVDGADVVQGRTVPDPERAHLLGMPFARSLRVDEWSGFYQTCNIAYRRVLLEQLGGFDEGFRLACDDTDLGWRAKAAGARITFASDVVVEHEVAVRSWRDELRTRRRWADTVKVVARHPDVRVLAWHRFLYRRTHAPVLLGAATLPLLLHPRTRRTWMVAAAAAAIREGMHAGSPRALARVTQQRAIDVYETAVLVRSSVRERTVLL
jgi:GT2 family glycosyltransferase